ncbi:MAG TPA: hypothetical protein VGO62_07810 [Myxococcota bacterium]
MIFRQNIGALIIRFHSNIEGELCKSCIHAEFWKRTAVNVSVGWLGYISLFVAPIFTVMNIANYASAASLAPPGNRTVDNDPAAMRRLVKALPFFAKRINAGEPIDQIVDELARAGRATVSQTHVFLRMISAGRLLPARPAPATSPSGAPVSS